MNRNASRAALIDVYKRLGRRAGDIPSELRNRMNTPYVIWPQEEWWTAPRRIMLVGQEPWEWGFKRTSTHYHWPHAEDVFSLDEFAKFDWAPEALMDGYTATMYGADKKYTGGAFARATALATNSHSTTEVVTTNLFRCAVSKDGIKNYSAIWNTTPSEREKILAWQRGVLQEEIRLLQPDAILFLTGPNYDQALDVEIPGAVRMEMAGRTLRQVARIAHAELPPATIRTYHPGYLARGRWSWLEQIFEGLKEVGGDSRR